MPCSRGPGNNKLGKYGKARPRSGPCFSIAEATGDLRLSQSSLKETRPRLTARLRTRAFPGPRFLQYNCPTYCFRALSSGRHSASGGEKRRRPKRYAQYSPPGALCPVGRVRLPPACTGKPSPSTRRQAAARRPARRARCPRSAADRTEWRPGRRPPAGRRCGSARSPPAIPGA